ncbi:GNAT family N-acetyltransferase [Lacticaseibacillus kribbianus]|uniref:GNAT family N-acetyltransferase n=1 Tax=Lacticaseibacillus kribbianus TaxID=2926292 RepID=UPI001CD3A8BA|nr:GNAT family N-acetyltransferase [Lacticaseibacillus kribbianus]
MRIQEVTGDRAPYRQLLLLGDEDPAMLDRYWLSGTLLAAVQDGEPIGVALVTVADGTGGTETETRADRETAPAVDAVASLLELKNLAVAEPWQRHGVGAALVNAVLDRYQGAAARLIVGTGDADFANLRFYRRLGFRFCGVRREFFTAYQAPIVVDGLALCDMVLLDHSLG